jgi:hypothetical protein
MEGEEHNSLMRQPRISLTVVLIVVITEAGWATPRQAARSTPAPTGAPAAIPSLWRSETTHSFYRVRVKGNSIHAVQSQLPFGVAKHGGYVRTECRRAGDHWIGTTSSFLKVTGSGPHRPAQSNWCHLTTRTEFFSISATSITGRAEAIEAMDVAHCHILQKRWKDFVWKPVKLNR